MGPRLPKNRDLRTFLLAQSPADFADWLDFLAKGPPDVLIGPVADALVDRVSGPVGP